jgi:MFS family permease
MKASASAHKRGYRRRHRPGRRAPGGTLPIPLYVLYERQMGFGPLGVTVVFAAYVIGTLAALVVFGDLSDHLGRRKVLAIGVACAAVSTAGFLIASDIGLLIAARIVSGLAAGFVTGTATAALAELQPRGNRLPVVSTFFAAAYLGLGLPPVLTGLISQAAGTVDASAWTSGITAVIVAAAIVVVARTFGTATQGGTTPGAHSDSWCCPAEPGVTRGGQAGARRAAATVRSEK